MKMIRVQQKESDFKRNTNMKRNLLATKVHERTNDEHFSNGLSLELLPSDFL